LSTRCVTHKLKQIKRARSLRHSKVRITSACKIHTLRRLMVLQCPHQ
jgi:hypothetical protein